MKADEIPDFIVEMMEKVELGIDTFSAKRLGEIPEDSMLQVAYPEFLELMLSIEYYDDNDEYIDHQQVWIKIPWPEVHHSGRSS